MQEPDAYPPLDFPKVKEDLAGGPNKKKALLLQAIRWVRENLQSLILFVTLHYRTVLSVVIGLEKKTFSHYFHQHNVHCTFLRSVDPFF